MVCLQRKSMGKDISSVDGLQRIAKAERKFLVLFRENNVKNDNEFFESIFFVFLKFMYIHHAFRNTALFFQRFLHSTHLLQLTTIMMKITKCCRKTLPMHC